MMVKRYLDYCYAYRRYGWDLLIVLGLFLGYHLLQAYRHFEWQNVKVDKGYVVALPSFRK